MTGISSKKALKPAIKRELVIYLTAPLTISIRLACRMIYFYPPDTRHDEPVLQVLTELVERDLRYGFKKLF
jgi:putative transposase